MTDCTLLDYHERSAHRLNRYAPGPGRLDWANRPDPFRRYEGAQASRYLGRSGEIHAEHFPSKP